MSDLERRDFCRILTGCTLLACTGGLAGCARLLDWSAGTDAGRGRVATMAANPPVVETSSTITPSATVPPPALPDLAVYTGDDPAANVRAAVAALGGMERFVRRGEVVLLHDSGGDRAATVQALPELIHQLRSGENRHDAHSAFRLRPR